MLISKFKKKVMMNKLKMIEIKKSVPGCKDIKERLNNLWINCVTLSLRNKGTVVFSIIPQDMLIRVFYENQVSYDLLSWVTNTDKFTKVKCNQILMHFASLVLQFTPYKFEGET